MQHVWCPSGLATVDHIEGDDVAVLAFPFPGVGEAVGVDEGEQPDGGGGLVEARLQVAHEGDTLGWVELGGLHVYQAVYLGVVEAAEGLAAGPEELEQVAVRVFHAARAVEERRVGARER